MIAFFAWAQLLLFSLAEPPAQDWQLGEFRWGGAVDSRREGDSFILLVPDLRYRKGDIRLSGDFAVLWLDAQEYDRFRQRRKDEDKLHNGALLPDSRGRLQPSNLSETMSNLFGKKKSDAAQKDEGFLPEGLVREIYVEGTVYFSSAQDRALQGSRLYADFTTGRVLIENGRMQTTNAGYHGAPLPLSVKAEWFRREATGKFVADDAKYTTCEFALPHQYVKSDQVWLKETPYGTAIDAYKSTFKLDDTSLLYFPRVTTDPETQDLIPFRGAQVGTSSNFGFFVYSKWGHGFHELGEDFNELILGKRETFHGDWGLRLDYRGERGFAFGPELEWDTPGYYKGRVRTYFLKDADQDHFFYPGTLLRDNDQRYSVRFENRIFFGKEWTFDAEVNAQSDPGVIPEFFRREFFSEKEPETSAYVRWSHENQAFTALVNAPINEFDPTPVTGYGDFGTPVPPPILKESLPEFQHHWFNQPGFELSLPAGTGEYANRNLQVYYTEESSAGYLRRRPAQGLDFRPGSIIFIPTETMDSARFDTMHSLRAPFHADPFVLTPYVTEGYTWYSDSAAGNQIGRLVNEAGVRLSTHFQKGLSEKYEHLIDPAISYQNRYTVSKDPTDLIQFDDVDALTKDELILFTLRNRLVDVTPLSAKAPENETPWRPVLDLDLRLPMYLNPDRDNQGDRFGNLETNFAFNSKIASGPFRNLSGTAEIFSEIENAGFQFHKMNYGQIGLSSAPTDALGTYVTYTRLRSEQDGELITKSFSVGATYNLGEKWSFAAAEAYDFETRKSLSHGLTFKRIGHDWIIEIVAGFNDLTDEKTFAFNIQPRLLVQRGRQVGAVSNLLSSSLAGQTFYTNNNRYP